MNKFAAFATAVVAVVVLALLAFLALYRPGIKFDMPATDVNLVVKYDRKSASLQLERLRRILGELGARNGYLIELNTVSVWDCDRSKQFGDRIFQIKRSGDRHFRGAIDLREGKMGDVSLVIQGEREFIGLEILAYPFSKVGQEFEIMSSQIAGEVGRSSPWSDPLVQTGTKDDEGAKGPTGKVTDAQSP